MLHTQVVPSLNVGGWNSIKINNLKKIRVKDKHFHFMKLRINEHAVIESLN